MAKLHNGAIDAAHLIEYLDTSSDFAFELRCLKLLYDMDFKCQHAGSYTDPVTKKTRQFDIRAERAFRDRRIRCAIECKNVRDSFPLLVSCVPRSADESFHDLIFAFHPDMVEQSRQRIPAFDRICTCRHVDCRLSVYRPDDPVGKECAQVGQAQDGTMVATNSEVYEKWSQALASAQDLADESTRDGVSHRSAFFCLVLPVVVVPDGTLWEVRFDSEGTRRTDPVQTKRCPFYVGRLYTAGSMLQCINIMLSHLEFVTLSGLKSLMEEIVSGDEYSPWFPYKHDYGRDTVNND